MAGCRHEPVAVRQTFGVFVCREIVVWEGVNDLDRDVRDAMGVPERAVRPVLSFVVKDRSTCLVRRTQQPVAVNLELPSMTLDEMAERLLVPSLRASDQIAVHRVPLTNASPRVVIRFTHIDASCPANWALERPDRSRPWWSDDCVGARMRQRLVRSLRLARGRRYISSCPPTAVPPQLALADQPRAAASAGCSSFASACCRDAIASEAIVARSDRPAQAASAGLKPSVTLAGVPRWP